jgi:comEA protein
MSADRPDWRDGGPAKWAAVAVLGAASVAGITYSAVRQHPGVPSPPIVLPAPSPTPALTTPAPERSSPTPAAAPASAPAPSAHAVLDLNTASAAELELLPGIGPALASRIVEHRATVGLFARVDDLDKVRGIGPKLLERLRPYVRVAPGPRPVPAGTMPTSPEPRSTGGRP